MKSNFFDDLLESKGDVCDLDGITVNDIDLVLAWKEFVVEVDNGIAHLGHGLLHLADDIEFVHHGIHGVNHAGFVCIVFPIAIDFFKQVELQLASHNGSQAFLVVFIHNLFQNPTG